MNDSAGVMTFEIYIFVPSAIDYMACTVAGNIGDPLPHLCLYT